MRDYKDKPWISWFIAFAFALTDIAKFAFRNIFLRKFELLHVFKYVIGKSPLTQRQLDYI